MIKKNMAFLGLLVTCFAYSIDHQSMNKEEAAFLKQFNEEITQCENGLVSVIEKILSELDNVSNIDKPRIIVDSIKNFLDDFKAYFKKMRTINDSCKEHNTINILEFMNTMQDQLRSDINNLHNKMDALRSLIRQCDAHAIEYIQQQVFDKVSAIDPMIISLSQFSSLPFPLIIEFSVMVETLCSPQSKYYMFNMS